MNLKFNNINCSIGSFQVQMEGFTFVVKDENFYPVAHEIHLPDLKNTLFNCFVASWDDTYLVRSSSIDSKVKALEYCRLIKSLQGKEGDKRLVSIQVSQPEFDWEAISSQHQILHATALNLAHINVPLEKCSIPKEAEFKLPQVVEALENLSSYQNADGYIQYCKWFLQYLNEAKERFFKKSAEEYRLEARFDDFRHEINSAWLRKVLEEIDDLLKENANVDSPEQLIKSEKKLLNLRYELLGLLQKIHELLGEIGREIKVLELQYPKLYSVGLSVDVFQKLLANHSVSKVHQLMLIAFINHVLKVKTSICCETGVERTSLAFSVMLAVEIMFGSHSENDIAGLVCNWEEGHYLKKELIQTVKELFNQFSLPVILAQKDLVEFKDSSDFTTSIDWNKFDLKVIR